MTRLMKIPGRPMSVRAGHPKIRIPFIADDFARANSASLGTTPLGDLAWTKPGNPAAVIESGALDFRDVKATGRVVVDTGKTARRVSCRVKDLGVTSATMAGGLIFWADNADSYFYLAFRQNAGKAGTALVSWTGETIYYATSDAIVSPGDVVTVTTTATGAVTAYINGVQIMQASIPFPGTGFSRAGFLAHASGTALKTDYFTVSDL